ncbi:MAG TPA: D-glycero-beta-D-manno-heptose 1-phosphate adenylyltransferase [Pseudonocardiaceae bacterium]|jgi:D-beta-D-heptose 7-phosphate kinase/D-beta-D-heptose 1-phosphate adenosyltransferase|nr:D-glycero-beta-D-manno-heptose 1-phosphate adenylyltransferase [Pseudonocardiaceae bacterium]
MSGARLVVIGDTLLDSDVEGRVDRLCPDAPVPVVDVQAQRWRPGGAGLAALLAARAGHDVVLVTALGADPSARLLADLLASRVELVRMPLRGATACKTRIRTEGRSLLRVDAGDGRAAGAPAGNRFPSVLGSADAVLVSDYGRDVTADPTIRDALLTVTRRVPVVWDPHPRGALPVPGCRLVTPNEAEASGVVPTAVGGSMAAAALRGRWRCDAVAVTLGARGAVLATAQGCTAVPVPELAMPEDRDTCGAGDAFAAAVTGVLLGGSSISTAVAAAVCSASEFVAAGGAASVNGLPAGPPASSPGSATDVVARLRRWGGRLVATGGCFDLLHPGHLSLLRQARALGDALVVCVNSDESVRRRKGPARPIVPAAGRIAMLEALEPVDAVIMFNEDTPATLLETVRPDVWVKGGDYTISELPEEPVVRRHGGRVVIIPLLDGYSTSRLVSAAQPRFRRRMKEKV